MPRSPALASAGAGERALPPAASAPCAHLMSLDLFVHHLVCLTALARQGEEEAPTSAERALFCMLVYALRHLANLLRLAHADPKRDLFMILGPSPDGPALRFYLWPRIGRGQHPPDIPADPPADPAKPLPDGLVRVPFHGDEIEVYRRGEDRWLPLRPMCERLGLSFAAQTVKLKGYPWAVVSMIEMTGADGKTYEMFALHLRSLAGWLFSIRASRVAPELREKLTRYQREANDVLYRHFAGAPAALPG